MGVKRVRVMQLLSEGFIIHNSRPDPENSS